LLADLYNAVALKAKCLNYISANATQVQQQHESWAKLKTKPDLLVEIIAKITNYYGKKAE